MSNAEPSQLERITVSVWRKYKQGNSTAIEESYDKIMPFCLRVCARTCGRYIDNSDEEASIARMAMLEAFDKYEPQRGSLLLYLGYVIRNRIIDYRRSEEKRNFTPFSAFQSEPYQALEGQEDPAGQILEDLARQQDLERFKSALQQYDIGFDDLVKGSPRQKKTLKAAISIAEKIASDQEMCAYLQEKRMIPIRMLETRCNANRKIIDRYRKFIIASALILIHDIQCLRPYIENRKGGQSCV
ncbi:MAG: sigma-70 family RNA polymerase sigma factor [Syntrophomonadaceae bacterium]|jgi:RNA polymerase sigma factor|nr:sigma-70 family RNA polymerase sigma factor [Syntrophomonadaceae bacterium]